MKTGGGRLLAAALCVAAMCSTDRARAAGEIGDPSTPYTPPGGAGTPTAGWSTQHWPMHGQRGDQRRRINEDFTSARYRNGGAYVLPDSWGTGRSPVSEVVTAWSPGMDQVGPHGSWAVSSAFQQRRREQSGCGVDYSGPAIAVGLSTAGWQNFYNFGSPCMPLNSVGIIASPCDDLAGAPILIGDSTVFDADLDNGSKIQIGLLHVYAVANDCPNFGGLGYTSQVLHSAITTSYFPYAPPGGGLPVTVPYADELQGLREGYPILGNAYYSPTMVDNVLFVATAREDPDNYFLSTPNQASGVVYAINRGSLEASMSEKWSAALQLGSGSTGPLPKGQEPPPAAERFHPVTPVAAGEGLVVVGCVKWQDDYSLGYYREIQTDNRLFAFDAGTGQLRFTYLVDARIMETPAITPEYVVFGTKNGRAYAVQHSRTDPSIDGVLKWQTSWTQRITYRTHPFSSPQSFADTALFGPAIDGAGDNAYFGGSDGRIHRFSVSGGALTSSAVLMYFRELELYSWGFNVPRDGNGLDKIRPCRISSAPVVYRNRALLVKTHTNTQTPDGINGAFLCILRLPDMTMNQNFTTNTSARVDITDGVFSAGGSDWGAVALNGFTASTLMGWDSINQIPYVNDAGIGLSFGYNDETDVGGVSMGDGYVFTTDGSGTVRAFPSDVVHKPPAPSGQITPTPPAPGPVPDPGPPPLGPVEAFPNPFMPARAKGGTFKFRNLPLGTRVELYTLAFERVKAIAESGNRAEWDATNEAGQPVASGVYLYKIFFPDERPAMSGRVVLTR